MKNDVTQWVTYTLELEDGGGELTDVYELAEEKHVKAYAELEARAYGKDWIDLDDIERNEYMDVVREKSKVKAWLIVTPEEAKERENENEIILNIFDLHIWGQQ